MTRSIFAVWLLLSGIAAAEPRLELSFPGHEDAPTFTGYEGARLRVHYVGATRTTLRDGFQFPRLSIDAANQAADYFDHRPGPSVSLHVTPAGDPDSDPLPIIVTSSGGGTDDLSVTIVILGPESTRRAELGEYVVWLSEQSAEPRDDAWIESTVDAYDRLYVRSPSGRYRATAIFTPDGDAAQPEPLAAAATFEVIEGPSLIELMQQARK